jgi:hypothetical protein
MNAFICDLTDLTGIWGAEAPDIIICGAISISSNVISQTQDQIRRIKASTFGDPEFPVKWNLKDIQRACRLHEIHYDPQVIKAHSNKVRENILSVITENGITLFYSIIIGYSNRKEVLEHTRERLTRYSFSNLLMRLGLFKKLTSSTEYSQLLMDWPESSNRDPFISEYLHAWKYGKASPKLSNVQYYSGPLRALNFSSSIYFGITDCDCLLQLADIAIGAFRSFIDYSMEKVDVNNFGVQAFKKVMKSISGWSSNYGIGTGISISPRRSPLFIERITRAIKILQS